MILCQIDVNLVFLVVIFIVVILIPFSVYHSALFAINSVCLCMCACTCDFMGFGWVVFVVPTSVITGGGKSQDLS